MNIAKYYNAPWRDSPLLVRISMSNTKSKEIVKFFNFKYAPAGSGNSPDFIQILCWTGICVRYPERDLHFRLILVFPPIFLSMNNQQATGTNLFKSLSIKLPLNAAEY